LIEKDVQDMVMTVKGPMPSTQMGITHTHEHLLCDLSSVVGENLIWVLDNIEKSLEELNYFKNAGGKTIVEVSNIGLKRDVLGLKKISEISGINIIAGSGYYIETTYPQEVYELGTNMLAKKIIKEIEEGIDDTGIKPGIIGEIGIIGNFLSPVEERVFRSVARAHLNTGVAITTHTFHGRHAHTILDLFEEEGVDLGRVIIGHLGSKKEIDLYKSIAKRGAFVEFDYLGNLDIAPVSDLVESVVQLKKSGYLRNILFSHDICKRSMWKSLNGVGYDYCLKEFVPLLLENGIHEEEVETILVENPRYAMTIRLS
jgi:phosphotriesterase-related protein